MFHTEALKNLKRFTGNRRQELNVKLERERKAPLVFGARCGARWSRIG